METRWGKRLGRYEIVSELGRGAMGVVYKARDPKIDRFVAIKAISLPGLQTDQEFRSRFFVEAQAAGRLLHAGIVTIFDVGEEPETHDPFIVMEYVPGPSLEQLLSDREKKMSLVDALRVTEELAEALDCAHGQGIVHRDIKPANILITPDGHPKIADFGIARLDNPNLTIPGRVLGTPAYMSPEQLEGMAVDGRSDLFSLGVILYRMVTGYGPFQGSSITTVCFKVANRDPVAASTLNPELPSQLDSIITRAIAKEPKDRYQRGMEFSMDLREARERIASGGKPNLGHIPSADLAASTRNGSWEERPSGRVQRWRNGLTADIRRFCGETLRPWSKRPAVRASFVIAIVAIALAVPAHYENGPIHIRDSRRVIASASSVAPISQTVPAASMPQPVISASPAPKASKGAAPVADSVLQVEIKHGLSEPTLSMWIDDRLVYSAQLRKPPKPRLAFFRGSGPELQTFHLPHGKRQIRVHVRSIPDNYENSATVSATFEKATARRLRVSCDKQTGDMQVAFK